MKIKLPNIEWKVAVAKAAIVLVPSYTAAYLTEQMVWVVPTLAASSFFAGSLQITDDDIRKRVEEDGVEDIEGDSVSEVLKETEIEQDGAGE